MVAGDQVVIGLDDGSELKITVALDTSWVTVEATDHGRSLVVRPATSKTLRVYTGPDGGK